MVEVTGRWGVGVGAEALLRGTSQRWWQVRSRLRGAHTGLALLLLNRTFVFLHSPKEHGFAQFEKPQKRKKMVSSGHLRIWGYKQCPKSNVVF